MRFLGLKAAGDLLKRYALVCRTAWEERKQHDSLPREKDEAAFLPAHLELTETPVSALPKWSARLIMLFFLLALIWAYFGKVEVVTVAQGKITSSSRSKSIQPFETALVKNIYVKNGEKVKKDQLLIELTAMGVETDFSKSEETLKTMALNQQRISALLIAIEQEKPPIFTEHSSLPLDFPISDEQLAQEKELALNQYLTWQAQKSRLFALTEQKKQEQKTISSNIVKLSDMQRYEKERSQDLYKLYKQHSASKHEYYQQVAKQLEVENNLETQRSRYHEIEKEIHQANQEYQAFLTTFRRDLLDELKRTTENFTQTKLELDKAKQRQTFMEIRSPIDGIVQQLQTYTIGGVVTTAQQLMVIAPEEDSLEVEALISNQDIGFVKTGQEVVLKIAAFPYTRYGYIHGKVKHISLDAIPDEKLGYVFATTILMDRNYLTIQDTPIYLKQGMIATAEIKTDQRRVMDYFLSPLKTTVDESLRER